MLETSKVVKVVKDSLTRLRRRGGGEVDDEDEDVDRYRGLTPLNEDNSRDLPHRDPSRALLERFFTSLFFRSRNSSSVSV